MGSYQDFRRSEDRSNNQAHSTTPSPSTVPESQQSTARPPMTVEELVQQPGRTLLRRLHPKRLEKGSTWFGYTKNGISKSILRMLHGMLKHPYPTYSDMPSDDRELWFRTFAHEFDWDTVHTPLVRVAFTKYASLKYSGHMNAWKEKWAEGKECPKGLNPDVWPGFKQYWGLPDTARTAETNSKNRKSQRGGKGMAVHNAGSTSFLSRIDELTEKNGGVEPDFVDVIEDTHTNKKTGKIQDGYIAGLVETLKKRKTECLTQLSQNDDGSSSSNVLVREKINRMVLEEIPLKRGRVVGLGSLNQSNGCSYSGPSQNSEIFAELEEKDKEILALKEQNKKILDFMRSKFSDFPDDL